MRIRYLEDTDTAFIEFTAKRVAETQKLCENIYIALDERGDLVSMKIERTKQSADILEFTFERQPTATAESVYSESGFPPTRGGSG